MSSDIMALLFDPAVREILIMTKGGKLLFRPKLAMTADQLERLKGCKGELLAILSTGPAPEAHVNHGRQRFPAVRRLWPDGFGSYEPSDEIKQRSLAKSKQDQTGEPEKAVVQRAERGYAVECFSSGFTPLNGMVVHNIRACANT